MFYVYILRSLSNNKLYTGHTNNLENRINAHNTGKSKYTKGRGPWKLMYFEEFESRGEAMKREKFLKTGKGRELLSKIIDKKNI